jgi:GTP-binding protein
VVGSKSDVAAGPVGDRPELTISAVTGAGIPELLVRLAAVVVEARTDDAVPTRSFVIHRPLSEEIEVARADDGSFVVLGRPALRAVALSDLTDIDAVDYVQHRLRRLGVERALVRAGVRDGDVVHLGALSFTYKRDEGIDAAVPGTSPPESRRGRRGGRGESR